MDDFYIKCWMRSSEEYNNIENTASQKALMLPIENTFNMYHFYPQYNFSMFHPCFYYPQAINQA
jgi:hypothetical protein